MRILVPVDGSKYSRTAVDFVASRSTLVGANPEVEVLNVQLAIPTRATRVVRRFLLRADAKPGRQTQCSRNNRTNEWHVDSDTNRSELSAGYFGATAGAKLIMLRLSGNSRSRFSGLVLRPFPQSPVRPGAASNAAISTCPEKSKASMT